MEKRAKNTRFGAFVSRGGARISDIHDTSAAVFLLSFVVLLSCRASYDAELGRRSAEIFNEMAQTSIMPPTYQPPAALDLSEQYVRLILQ